MTQTSNSARITQLTTAPVSLVTRVLLGACATVLIAAGPAGAAGESNAINAPPPHEILSRLRPGHPRLLASRADFEKLRLAVKENATLRDWRGKLAARADRILSEAPSKYEIPDGLRLLSVSRRVLDRVYTLALMYWLDGDQRYPSRAWKELEAAAAFPDWNPRHFLDTAEMTHAFAIGYDWLYECWTPEQREILCKAMVEKGLGPALQCYQGKANYGRWMTVRHNWNQVCNGGIGMGALALGDVEPELAGELLKNAIGSIQLAMREFAPDGAWAEGPGYWNYATQYNVAFLAGLETALGTDYGLSDINGFAEAGMFPIYITGPLNRTFNYADGGEGPVRAPQMHWLGRRFKRPAYAVYQLNLATPHPLDLLWYDRALAGQGAAQLPLDRRFRGAEIATFRSGWANRDALFVGFKGGDNKANHSHLDLGTFVLDAGETRWAVDLGADNYNLPAYFGAKRWTYYRLRAEGHNTVVINPDTGPDQQPSAAAPLIQYESKPEAAFAIADLTAAYAKHAQSVRRGIAVVGREHVIVQDEIRGTGATNIWWFMHTPADIEIGKDGKTALLKNGERRLSATLLAAPAEARFEVLPARPLATSPNPAEQGSNEKVRKLAVHLECGPGGVISVAFGLVPSGGGDVGKVPSFLGLESWGKTEWKLQAGH
ncbi:MAG: heparinase II/III family protein [Verrucomicrobiota bacterium]|nr:heparinase II/III family protein [Verrucomicrobiota bacterium]